MTEKEYQDAINAAALARFSSVCRELAGQLRGEIPNSDKPSALLLEGWAEKLEAVRAAPIEIVDTRFQGRPPFWAPRLAKALGCKDSTPIEQLIERAAKLSGEEARETMMRGDDGDGDDHYGLIRSEAHKLGIREGFDRMAVLIGGLLGMKGERTKDFVLQEISKMQREQDRVRSEMQTKIDQLEETLAHERLKIACATEALHARPIHDEDGTYDPEDDARNGWQAR